MRVCSDAGRDRKSSWVIFVEEASSVRRKDGRACQYFTAVFPLSFKCLSLPFLVNLKLSRSYIYCCKYARESERERCTFKLVISVKLRSRIRMGSRSTKDPIMRMDCRLSLKQLRRSFIDRFVNAGSSHRFFSSDVPTRWDNLTA